MKNDARIPLSASQFSQANGSKGAKGAKGRGHHPYPEEDPESAIHVAALSIYPRIVGSEEVRVQADSPSMCQMALG